MDGGAEDPAKKRRTSWKKDPEAVRENILTIATQEFAAHGLSGANINEIARNTSTSKRMIYYYFGDKEGLYQAVLERVYSMLRENEDRLKVENLGPVEGLALLVRATFEAHAATPVFIRLVMIENIHNAQNLVSSQAIRNVNAAAIDKLASICRRGEAAGVFRQGLDPVALHWQISAASFFNVSNRPTFSAIFGDTMFAEDAQEALRHQTVEAILAITEV